jgi:phospholipid transport system transporter-binding protein
MTQVTIEQIKPAHFLISGELDIHTVPHAERQMAALLNQLPAGELCIDLKAVSRCDSAGLALLVAWLRAAKRRQLTLVYRHLPEQLLQIARVTEVDHLLPLSA